MRIIAPVKNIQVFWQLPVIMEVILMAKITAIKKINNYKLILEINKNNFEKFCATVGIFKKEFIRTLNKSLDDHKHNRITRRKSLRELMS